MSRLENNAQKANRLALEALPEIVKATQDESVGYLFTTEEIGSNLEKKGLVEVNQAIKNDAGELATRATEKGIALVLEKEKEDMSEETVTVAPVFEIEDVVVVPKRSTSGKKSIYPFDALEVDQSFFIPATDEKPEPWKTMSGTISSANSRYLELVTDATTGAPVMRQKLRGPNKGDDVQETKATKKFAIVEAEKDGVKGARIGRIL